MADHLTPLQRSANMAAVRQRDTTPELVVRRAAHALGYRFRLHRADLPGRPDLCFPKLRLIVFVHGCFWHRHEGCSRSGVPKSNTDAWTEKFRRNVARDAAASARLRSDGWKVEIIWECETKRPAVLAGRLSSILSGSASARYMQGETLPSSL
ncbi:very short patch repair endonuclease [Aliihoeflea sp. PC F10.4]